MQGLEESIVVCGPAGPSMLVNVYPVIPIVSISPSIMTPIYTQYDPATPNRKPGVSSLLISSGTALRCPHSMYTERVLAALGES